jgi:predicted peptidase
VRIALGILLFFTSSVLFGQQTGKSITATYELTQTMGYLLYIPESYNDNPGKEYPLILFLHGSGERGNDLEKVKVHGPPKLAEQESWEFIVVSPQCPENERWNYGGNLIMLSRLLDTIEDEYRVDANRIYLTGLSMGGQGAWELAAYEPERFAAIAPVCGRTDTTLAERFQKMSVWVFHGAKDSVVPLQESEQMVEAIKPFNPEIRFTVYPEAGHDSWTETYNNPELYTWMLSHSLNDQ